MLESVNIHSNVAVYVQIENEVMFAIASGKVKEGEQLPSIIGAAERVGVNMNTVAKAYRDLEVMGYVFSRRGMGVFVNKGVSAKCRTECRKQLAGRLHEVVAEAKAAGMSATQVKQVAAKCLSVDSPPYGKMPKEVLALAKAFDRK